MELTSCHGTGAYNLRWHQTLLENLYTQMIRYIIAPVAMSSVGHYINYIMRN
jgi:hypothetical protein